MGNSSAKSGENRAVDDKLTSYLSSSNPVLARWNLKTKMKCCCIRWRNDRRGPDKCRSSTGRAFDEESRARDSTASVDSHDVFHRPPFSKQNIEKFNLVYCYILILSQIWQRPQFECHDCRGTRNLKRQNKYSIAWVQSVLWCCDNISTYQQRKLFWFSYVMCEQFNQTYFNQVLGTCQQTKCGVTCCVITQWNDFPQLLQRLTQLSSSVEMN